ncbi:MAG TPA: bifunctional serine/threonine-protein kinase/formylglycine-generating enzyme family protein [Planctomycetota bacterium]|nr:bifunctional serine/threonine-protein kinase/formylglycine-generating enzyme family protein [Planctomycetota bacterium]
MSPVVADTKQQLELRLLLAAAARAGIAPTVAASGSGVIETIRDASVRGARLVEERRSQALGCRTCGAVWKDVLVPEGALDVGCPSCEGELAPVDVGRLESAHTVATPSPGAVTVASPAESARPAAPATPASLGPYEVVRVLGRGGMGAVLEATDTRSGASVALKLISGWGATDVDARTRFLREGKVLTLLAHPHVVRFVEQGELDGQLYIAMELVRGSSLADVLAAGKLPVLEAVRHARAIAEGLAYAHALGLTHRDVKPANVLLGEDGSIKLADFGLARRSQESLALTAPGTVVGTPVYMAPEQLEGKTAGPPADCYALGVLLYHMLAGAPPFEGSFAQIAIQRAKKPIAPLARKCPEVPAVLASLTDRLLATDPAARPTATEAARTLATLAPASTVVRAAAPRVERDPRSLEAASKLGSFTIEGRLGAGGMGSVYRARSASGELVALKVLAKPLDPAASQRFAREARALSEIEHPNVVRFLDAGEADGLAWIATELVPGRPLDAIVNDEGPLPEARLIGVAEAVGKGLAALHAKKIVHRDVKPQNVVLGDGRIVLVDLGLAKFLATQTAVTEAGALLGTPHYMAPEQLLGKNVDGRTDLYSLGALLHHAATAKRPFDGESNTAVAFQQVNVTPPSLRKVRPGISAPFAELVQKLLEKARDRRPASAAELLALLERVRRGQPLDESRARIVRLAYVALVLIVIVGGAAAWWNARAKGSHDTLLARELLAKADAPAPAAAPAADEERAPAPKAAPSPPQQERAEPVVEGKGGGGAFNAPAPSMKPQRFLGPAFGSDEKKAKDRLRDVALDDGSRGNAGVAKENAPGALAGKPGDADSRTVVIPAGTYELGPPDKRRKVTLAAFSIDRAPVCRGAFDAYRSGAKDGHLACDGHEPKGYRHHDAASDAEDASVRGLDVWDAVAYARWAGGRLPTSDEWEAAFTLHPELAGTTYEWTLDFSADAARGRLHAGAWKKKDVWVELEAKDAGLDQCGFRVAKSVP